MIVPSGGMKAGFGGETLQKGRDVEWFKNGKSVISRSYIFGMLFAPKLGMNVRPRKASVHPRAGIRRIDKGEP